MSVILTIALQQLRARRRQALIIIGGVVLGVMVLLVTISLFDGLLQSFTAKILDVAPHVTMKAESAEGARADQLVEPTAGATGVVELTLSSQREERTRVRNVMSLLRSVERAMGSRLTAASPFLSTQALAAYGTNELTLPVVGVIPEREAQMNDLPKYLLSGSLARLDATRDGVLIGEKAASDLGVDFGDRVQLVSLSGEAFPVRVVGVYRIGVEATDRAAFVNIRLAQALERALPGEASGIGFQLRDVKEAPSAAREIASITGRETETWEQTNAGIIAIFKFLQMLFYVVVGFVIVICGFGVANILITTVLERRRDIAVMKSIGFSRGDIARLYMTQGLVIAIVGSVIGSAAGLGAITLMAMLPSAGSGGVAPIESRTLQMGFSLWYFGVAVGSTVIVSLVAAIAPARAAARVAPVEILRGER